VAFALFTDHTPPPVALDNVILDPTHTAFNPVIAATVGKALIIILVVVKLEQPSTFVTEYVTTDVPSAEPVNTPVKDPIVAFALLIVHVPPPNELDKFKVEPTHTGLTPVIVPNIGSALIVTLVVVKLEQPSTFVTEYVTTDVPAAEPVNTPVKDPIVAFALLIVHVPPPNELDKFKVEPTHTGLTPVMVPSIGVGLILNGAVPGSLSQPVVAFLTVKVPVYVVTCAVAVGTAIVSGEPEVKLLDA